MKRFLLLLSLAIPAAGEEADLRRAAAEGRTALARACERDGLVEEAIREWQGVLREDPENKPALEALAAAKKPWVLTWGETEQARHKEHLARERAFTSDLAARWVASGDEQSRAGNRDGAWMAYQRALQVDPDCRAAHAGLGEVRIEGAWVSEEEASKHEKGLLEIKGEWLPAADVRKRRSTWDEAWEVDGPHFHVRSNRSLASAREVLARAEEAHAAFWREIMGVVDPPPVKKKMPVLDFASWEDLDDHVLLVHESEKTPSRSVPGFFSWSDGAVHLGPLPKGSALTRDDIVRHECVHQSISRAIPLKGWITTRAGFWAWEGLASYFESVETRNGKILAGNPDHIRLSLARQEFAA